MMRYSRFRALGASLGRRLAAGLRARLRIIIVGALCVAAVLVVVAGLLSTSPVTISVVAATDKVVVRPQCEESVRLRLPAGRIQLVEKVGQVASHSVGSCAAMNVIIPRWTLATVTRRQGGPLTVVIATRDPQPGRAPCSEADRDGCIVVSADGRASYWPASASVLLDFAAVGADACKAPVSPAASVFQMPFSGELEIGGFAARAPGLEPSSLLYSGEIRVRSRAWFTGDRIELGTRALEAGDVVRTHVQGAAPVGAACEGDDATGVLWSAQSVDSDGGLRVVAHRVADNVEVVRSGPLQVGVSLLEQFVAQPLIRFLWQAVIAVFAMAAGFASLREFSGKSRRDKT